MMKKSIITVVTCIGLLFAFTACGDNQEDSYDPGKFISASSYYTIGLNQNGSAVAIGEDYDGHENDVSDWTDIVEVDIGYYAYGLKSDGTVVSTRENSGTQEWSDITSLAVANSSVIGLKSDGKVSLVPSETDSKRAFEQKYASAISEWSDLKAIDLSTYMALGLKKDNTVLVTPVNSYWDKESIKEINKATEWEDITAISAGNYHCVGLKSDGTVVAVGDSENGKCDVSDWTDIVAVDASSEHTVGLKKDGTVVATGGNGSKQCDVGDWTDIIAVAAGSAHTIGLKSDGTVVSTKIPKDSGYYKYDSMTYVDDWVLACRELDPAEFITYDELMAKREAEEPHYYDPYADSSSGSSSDSDTPKDQLIVDSDGKKIYKVYCSDGTISFDGSYSGNGNFIIELSDSNQDLEEIVCNEIGDYVVDKTVYVGEGYHYLEIYCNDGTWNMTWYGTGGD